MRKHVHQPQCRQDSVSHTPADTAFLGFLSNPMMLDMLFRARPALPLRGEATLRWDETLGLDPVWVPAMRRIRASTSPPAIERLRRADGAVVCLLSLRRDVAAPLSMLLVSSFVSPAGYSNSTSARCCIALSPGTCASPLVGGVSPPGPVPWACSLASPTLEAIKYRKKPSHPLCE